MKSYQIKAPEWASADLYAINARVPAGARKPELELMVQSLLVERFGLKFHRDSTEMPGYKLVLSRGGPTLKDVSSEVRPATLGEKGGFDLGKDGFPVLMPGRAGRVNINGKSRWVAYGISMSECAVRLSAEVGRPVVDETRLKGIYDVDLHWSSRLSPVIPLSDGREEAAMEFDGPSLDRALQQQLGLKLEAQKVRVPTIVVDQLSRKPTPN